MDALDRFFDDMDTLFRLIYGTNAWSFRQRTLIANDIPQTEAHLRKLYCYILELSSFPSELNLLHFVKGLPISGEVAESLQELPKYFIVPKQLDDKDNKNELLAAFISFLLQLLHKEKHWATFFDQGRIDNLKKELRFLVTILGDRSLVGAKLEEVKNFWAEFEAVANRAGSLVYSFVFVEDKLYMATRMNDDLDAIFDHINFLKGMWRISQRNLIANNIPRTEAHLRKVYCYILELSSINSGFNLLDFAKKVLLSEENVVSFMQEVLEYFIVPKQLDDNDNKNELLATFISFLLQLLHQKIHLAHSFEDQIHDFKKELRFLVTILGDRSLVGVELEEVKNLWAEFEAVANRAGSLVYSFIIAGDGVYMATRMDDDLDALFDHIKLLKGNINKSLNLLDDDDDDITRKSTVTVDSLFIVDSLLYDLEDLMDRRDDRIVDVEDQIKVLHRELKLSKSLLDDIKLAQHIEIEEAMTRIVDVGYEAEYLINSFLVGDAPLWYLVIGLRKFIHKTKIVGTKLQEIKKNYDKIGVLKAAKDLNAQLLLQGREINSEVDGLAIGLEDKTIHVLDQLVGGTKRLQIIIIFGMPGLGKTTLAKKLYNHPTVNCYVDRRSCCAVSQTYHRRSLLIGIMTCLARDIDKVKISTIEEEQLGECIHKSLKGRRYLILMDDIWDLNAWNEIRRYFPDDENGSRILFTSRNKDVAPPNSIIYELPSLSDDECWELLRKKVFHDEPCPPELQQIGKKIAENCHGLPLAVVVAAGILSNMNKEESAWKDVRGNLASHIFSDKSNSTEQILTLSYEHLPQHLKPCFLYFGAFLEDAEIPVKKLKCLWIAEGFIHKDEMLNTAESVAEEYLMELIDRSLIIVAKRRSDGGAKACVVHDLLRDLCLRIAKQVNFLKLMQENFSLYTRHHRLHVQGPIFVPYGLRIRSLFVSHLDSLSLDFHNFKLLILLDWPRGNLEYYDGSEHLVNLRYLAIRRMPASIDSLVNLEFLIVVRMEEIFGTTRINTEWGLKSISSIIQKLVKLKYLSVPNAYFDRNCNSYQTNNLQFLSRVCILNVKDEEILKCSPHLRKLKCVFAKHDGCRYPDLHFLTQLDSLTVWSFFVEAKGEINFPSNIKKLTLNNSSLSCENMSIIGELPKLEILKLRSINIVGKRWDTRDSKFQQLRYLELVSIDIVQWNVASSEHFPKLQRLLLKYCKELQGISWEIGEIATLQSIEVAFCPKSLGESALQIQQEQRDMGNEELKVIVSDARQQHMFDDDILL